MMTIGIDQYGNVYRNLGTHPRKMLMQVIGIKHANKMYVDRTKGPPVHIGYVVGKYWVTLYQRMEKPA